MPVPEAQEAIDLGRRTVRRLRSELRRDDPTARSTYLRAFHREFDRDPEPSSFDDLIIACFKADIVYVGDFHALPRSQEFAARLLDEIARRSRRAVLAVEMVYGRHQAALDRWMAGRISEAEFLRRIRYEQEWGYDWPAFRAVFDAARRHGIAVSGIDAAPRNGMRTIGKRDRHMAVRIAEIFESSPEAKVVALVGESHLATSHLPSKVREELARRNLERRSVRVLQNLEEPYWRLVAKGGDLADTVTLGRNVYCAFNASPLEKYEAYRQTLERWNQERPDDHELDLTPSIYNMIDTILKFLGVDKYRRRVERAGAGPAHLVDTYPEVYSSVDARRFRRVLLAQKVPRAGIDEILYHMRRNGSCYVPSVNAIYVGTFSLVHGGEEAAHFVHHALRGDLQAPVKEASRPDLFYEAVIEEAVGFFGSKLIDPSRNHFFETAFYRYYRRSPEEVEKETGHRYAEFRAIIDFILLHKKFERTYEQYADVPEELIRGIRTRSRRMFSILTHELGYFLGQQIHDGFHSGAISREEVAALFERRFTGRADSFRIYLDLTERLPGGVTPS